jgi:hypothetical protein
MTKKTPRGPIPSLIGGTNGRPEREDVGRLSKCYRCDDAIPAGRSCIAIPKLGSGFTTKRRVCDSCFEAILTKTTEDLEALRHL